MGKRNIGTKKELNDTKDPENSEENNVVQKNYNLEPKDFLKISLYYQ